MLRTVGRTSLFSRGGGCPASSSAGLLSSAVSTGASHRHQSFVASFFGLPEWRRGRPHTQEERDRIHRQQQAFEEKKFHTLGEYLERLPPGLRMTLTWTPVIAMVFFCTGATVRPYYLDEDESWYALAMPQELRLRLRARRRDPSVSLRKISNNIGSDMDNNENHSGDGEGRRTRNLSLPTLLFTPLVGANSNGSNDDTSNNKRMVATTEHGTTLSASTAAGGSAFASTATMHVKESRFLSTDDVMDLSGAEAAATRAATAERARLEREAARSYLSPVRWLNTLHGIAAYAPSSLSSFFSSSSSSSPPSSPLSSSVGAMPSPPLAPFSAEAVAVTVDRAAVAPAEEAALLSALQGSGGGGGGGRLIATAASIAAYSSSLENSDADEKDTNSNSKKKTAAKKGKSFQQLLSRNVIGTLHGNVWGKPLCVLRDGATGKVIGYAVSS